MKLKPIHQQVVVIVGASSGIGRVTALRFAQKGAAVVVAARNREGLESLASEIQDKGGRVVPVVADVASMDQMNNLAAQAAATFGRIDTWVQVAGVSVYATFEQTLPDEMKRVLEVNLLGQMHGALAALPYLRKQGRGALLHISSVEGRVALPYASAYAASKHGVIGFLDALRLELMHEGIPVAVTNIMPAGINTPLVRNAITRLGVQPRPVAPVYQPELVADALVYAAEHPSRDILVGGGAAFAIQLRRASRRLVDRLLLTRVGFESQRTSMPKSPCAPNNLFVPTPTENLQIHGDLGREALSTSLYTRLVTSLPARLWRGATDPFANAAARAVATLWMIRFGKSIPEAPPPRAPIEMPPPPPSTPTRTMAREPADEKAERATPQQALAQEAQAQTAQAQEAQAQEAQVQTAQAQEAQAQTAQAQEAQAQKTQAQTAQAQTAQAQEAQAQEAQAQEAQAQEAQAQTAQAQEAQAQKVQQAPRKQRSSRTPQSTRRRRTT